jgi:aminopeptidase YwaD
MGKMFRKISDPLLEAVSGVAARRLVADISRYHRIQASPDYRQAAEMVHETLLAWGLEAELSSFPANESTRFWGMRMFQEWSGVAGTLRLTAPKNKARILAEYRDVALSLIPRSAPFEGELELALPKNKGEEEEDYAELDVTGKAVVTNGDVMRVYKLAVEDKGARGIIFDGMRTLDPVAPKWALPDAIQYTSFWWWNATQKAFGFSLTPRQGNWLRRLIEEASSDEPVRVHARVVSRLYDGACENVTATIPGQTDDEILLVSHLCHPTPCANDNASGAAATMEVARALHSLVEDGTLPRPKRKIRFLWMPEMAGTYAFLAKRAEDGSQSNMIAGLNLDMVGEDQDQCGSVLLIDSPPESNPSFVVDLLERIRDELFNQGKSFSQRGGFPLFRYDTVPFSGGSDHYIFSDPTIGVPMPMLIQWPDRFYHTTADTLEKVSAEALKRSCVLAGTYAYWLATAGSREVDWLAHEMTACFKRRIISHLQNGITMKDDGTSEHGLPWRQRLDYWIERQQSAFDSLSRLQTDFDPKPWTRAAEYFANSEWATVEPLLQPKDGVDNRVESTSPPQVDDRGQRVPQREFPGPVSVRSLLRFHPPELADRLRALQEAHEDLPRVLPTLALYWADGKRDINEIVRMVELESGIRAPDYILGYFDILAELDMIAW